MTATTYMPHAAQNAPDASAHSRPSLLNRILDAIVEAQSRKAERMVGRHLAMLGDDHLAALGFTPEEIKAIRAGVPTQDVMERRRRSVA
ncbi:MAG: hypothetical protein AB7O44_18315 [Hyphomicrobiaceae bacterium]